jgi:NitT/TauT family transport system substrate-binding protein
MASDQELVVRKDRGILKPQDLKGKRVAVIRSGQTEFFLNSYLLFNRVPDDSLRVVYHTPSEMVRAMADGAIDAALCWPPYSTEMMKLLGGNGSRWPAQNGQEYYFTLFTNEDFLKKQAKTMERFLAALLEAELFITKYPEETKALLQQRLRFDAAILLETWSLVRFKLQLTQDLVVLMEREARWAIRNKIVDAKKMPNYLNFIYFDALDKVKPQAVSIVH